MNYDELNEWKTNLYRFNLIDLCVCMQASKDINKYVSKQIRINILYLYIYLNFKKKNNNNNRKYIFFLILSSDILFLYISKN